MKKCIRLTYPTFLVIFLLELFLRIFFRAPEGYFNFLLPASKNGLYPRNAIIFCRWGRIPYKIKTNSYGFRGDEVPLVKRKKIITIGDSHTDGFFVNNEETYPHYFGCLLDAKYKDRFAVINATRGGGSIDKELAIFKKIVLPLKPNMVILQFCTNDIYEIYSKSRLDLLNADTGFSPNIKKKIFSWLITRTAIGEYAYRGYLYFVKKESFSRIKLPEQYDGVFNGGDHFLDNTAIFNEHFKDSDGLVLREPFSDETNIIIGNYIFALGEFKKICQAQDVKLLFVYFPSYSQVYDVTTSMRMRDILADACRELKIPFLDLTPTFRKYWENKVLYFAPVDFHLNPKGNMVMASAIFEFLISQKLIDPD